MLNSAQAAQNLADQVSAGDRPLRAFGEDPVRPAANATELAALKALGGQDYDLYQLRFTQSPLVGRPVDPVVLRITPGQQRILGEAAWTTKKVTYLPAQAVMRSLASEIP
jgi:hypothetical protein